MTRLDVKQVVSVTHVIASMPSVLHPKVENLWTDLIRETLQRTPVDGAGDRWEAAVQHAKKHKNRGMGLLALTQIVALYLQSTALLHDKLVTCSSDGVDDEGCPDPHGDGTSRQSKTVGNGRGRRGLVGECNDSASSLDMQSVGCAPIILLDVAWWMERRLTSARCRNELLPVVGIVKMSQLLHNVVEHPTVKRAFNRTFAKGEAKPPLDRVIELEVAISKLDDVIPASSKLSSLESVILGQLPMRSSCRSEYVEQEGAKHYSTSMQMSTSSDAIKGTRDKWNGCVTVLVKNSSLRNAAYRMVYRDQARHDPGIVLESYGRSLKSACEDPECLSSSDRRHGRSCGVDGVQTLLTCILDVMRNLCALEATAGSISWPSGGHKPSPETGQTSCGQSKGQTGERGVSMLLTETIAIFNNAGATCECGIFSVLILIAEVAIPMIGATEGPAKAIELLHLMWQKWLCRTRTRTRTRPLEYGVVLKLTRMSFMLYGGHHRVSGEGSDRLQGCWVVSMLEDFPSLTGEMADVWPSLTRSLQPLINVAGGSRDTGHRERDDCLEHLSILHIVGKELLQLLTGGGLGTPLSALAQRSSFWRDDRRIPLEPVHNGPQGQTSGSDHSPSGEQVDWQEDQVYVRDVHAGHEAQRTMLRITELAQSSSCDTTKALPRSLSLVILNALDTAAVMLIETTKKRPHQELATAAVGTKRNKSAGAARVRASEDLPELLHGRESDKVDPQSFRSWHRHIKPTQWATCLLKPLFGEASERCNLSSVSTLLETMVGALGNPRRKEFEGDELKGLARSLKKSLVIGILEYAPSLVARVAEAPFLASSDLLVAPAESIRRSITLLDCLKGLSEEVLRRFMAEPTAWLTTVLSHYGAVLHTMANVSSMDTAVECIKGHEWELVVAFVHSQIRGISRRQLRLIPAAVALQEVDPLLKQYF